ncbi:MAG TPA: hypothetical protein VI423_00650 [Paenisporosarcina sp.]|nr:hypothetical protein [Paenisporosarcina sp.]
MVKTGDAKILDVINENDERVDDKKTHRALAKAKQGSSNNSGNKVESTVVEDTQDAETK